MSQRQQLLEHIALRLRRQVGQRVLRVAIDGIDGAGKTTFADELSAVLVDYGHPVIRASVDGFHHPRVRRYRLGRTSAEGFYRDSYDYEGLKQHLLDPLSPAGSGRYRTAIFDVDRDTPLDLPLIRAQPGQILLVDGLFLHRPELRHMWDDSVFLRVGFDVSVPRGAERGPGYGSPDPAADSNQRYVHGNLLYFQESRPLEHAGLVVDNTNLSSPYIV